MARRQKLENPDNPPRAGDIIDYIIVEKPGVKDLSEKCVEPHEVLTKNLQPDIAYQIKKMKQPLSKIFRYPIQKLSKETLEANTKNAKSRTKKDAQKRAFEQTGDISNYFTSSKKRKMEGKEEVKETTKEVEKKQKRKREDALKETAKILFSCVGKHKKKARLGDKSTLSHFLIVEDKICFKCGFNNVEDDTIAEGLCTMCQIDILFEEYRATYETEDSAKMNTLKNIIRKNYNEQLSIYRKLGVPHLHKDKLKDLFIIKERGELLMEQKKGDFSNIIKKKQVCYEECKVCTSNNDTLISCCVRFKCENFSRRTSVARELKETGGKLKLMYSSCKDLEW